MAGNGDRKSLRARIGAKLEESMALMAPARRLRLALTDRKLVGFAGAGPIRVLDAGCGDGLLLLSLAKRHPSWSLVGMDLREGLLAAARDRARRRSLPNAAFCTADLTKTLTEGNFDAVTAIECLVEIPDDRSALRAMVAALRPGGLFVVHVPDQRWAPILPGSPAHWRDEVRHGYDAEELKAMLSDAGLDRIEVRPTYRALATAAQELRDRVKGAPIAIRLALFPLFAAAVRLERLGLTWGRANALIAAGRRPESE
jgi:SAM-dependent methyltransferase